MGRGERQEALGKPGFMARRSMERAPQREGERRYSIEIVVMDKSVDPPITRVVRNPTPRQDRRANRDRNLYKGEFAGDRFRVVEEVALPDSDNRLVWQRAREVEKEYTDAPWVKALDDRVDRLNNAPLESSVDREITDEGMLRISFNARSFNGDVFTEEGPRPLQIEAREFDPVSQSEEAVAYHKELEKRAIEENMTEIEAARAKMAKVEAERVEEEEKTQSLRDLRQQEKAEQKSRAKVASALSAALAQNEQTVEDLLAERRAKVEAEAQLQAAAKAEAAEAEKAQKAERMRRALDGIG